MAFTLGKTPTFSTFPCSMFRFSVFSGAVVTFALLAACSGADSQDVLSSSAAASSGGPSGSGTPSDSADAGRTKDAGSPDDAGAITGSCADEEEDNGTREAANDLVPAVCGTIDTEDDVEFLTFELAGRTKSFSITHQGEVTINVEVGEQTFDLGDGSTPPIAIPVVKNQPYYVEVRAKTPSSGVPWRVELVEKK